MVNKLGHESSRGWGIPGRKILFAHKNMAIMANNFVKTNGEKQWKILGQANDHKIWIDLNTCIALFKILYFPF